MTKAVFSFILNFRITTDKRRMLVSVTRISGECSEKKIIIIFLTGTRLCHGDFVVVAKRSVSLAVSDDEAHL